MSNADLLSRYLALLAAALDAGLSKGAIAVFAVILDHLHSRSNTAFPGFARITERTGLHRTSAMRSVAELERAGYLIVDRTPNRPNRYQLASRMGQGGSADATSSVRATSSADATQVVASTHTGSSVDATRTQSLTHSLPVKESSEAEKRERINKLLAETAAALARPSVHDMPELKRKQKFTAADDLRGKVYTGTPIHELPPELRPHVEEAVREFEQEQQRADD